MLEGEATVSVSENQEEERPTEDVRGSEGQTSMLRTRHPRVSRCGPPDGRSACRLWSPRLFTSPVTLQGEREAGVGIRQSLRGGESEGETRGQNSLGRAKLGSPSLSRAPASSKLPPSPAIQPPHTPMIPTCLLRSARAPPSLVAKFLLRESPSSIPSTPNSPLLPFASSSNPFLPTKSHPDANSWTAPRYSLRRQKALRSEAALLGLDPAVLPPPAAPRPRTTPTANLIRASAHIPRASVLNEADVEKRGPYVGRKGAAFKGKVWERNAAARKDELKLALEGADAKIAAWRKVRLGDARWRARSRADADCLLVSFRPQRTRRRRRTLHHSRCNGLRWDSELLPQNGEDNRSPRRETACRSCVSK